MFIKNNKYNKITIIVLIILIVIMIIFIFKTNLKSKNINLAVNSEINQLEVLDINKNRVNYDFEGFNIVFYLSSTCSSCIEKLPSIKLFCEIFNDDEIKSTILWKDKIPSNLIDKQESNFNYLVKEVELSGTTPIFYIIDDSKVFLSTTEIGKLANKIKFRYSEEQLDVYLKKFLDKRFKDKNILFLNEEINKDNLALLLEENNIDKGNTIIISNNVLDSEYVSIYDPEQVISNLLDVTEFPYIIKR